MILQNVETGDGVAQNGSEDNVGRKVGALGDARKADGSRQAVGIPGNPAVISITAGDDGRHGSSNDHVPGRKAAANAGSRMEESLRESSPFANILGAPPVRGAIEERTEHFGIGDGFGGEERGLLHVGIVAFESNRVKSGGDGDCFRAGDVAGEGAIKMVESSGAVEIWLEVRIGGEQRDAGGDDRYSRRPLAFPGEFEGESPHPFLIAQKITRQEEDRNVARFHTRVR